MNESDWIDIFGDNLVDILKEANMTQRELADATGLSEASISRYVHKQTAPSIFAVINIAYALNCTVDDLVDFGGMIK